MFECTNCHTLFIPTRTQILNERQGKNPFCCKGCVRQYAASKTERSLTPWSWLRVRHVLDFLPKYTEPNDVYVGY